MNVQLLISSKNSKPSDRGLKEFYRDKESKELAGYPCQVSLVLFAKARFNGEKNCHVAYDSK